MVPYIYRVLVSRFLFPWAPCRKLFLDIIDQFSVWHPSISYYDFVLDSCFSLSPSIDLRKLIKLILQGHLIFVVGYV